MHFILIKKATLAATIPAKSLILHSTCCWSDAQWDATPSTHDSQIWELQWHDESRPSNLGMTGIGRREDRTIPLQNQLGNWLVRRYDFYTCAPSPPASLKIFRNKQQDARQYTHCGPVDPWLPLTGVLISRKSAWGLVLSWWISQDQKL
jgi:hypothetical protein